MSLFDIASHYPPFCPFAYPCVPCIPSIPENLIKMASQDVFVRFARLFFAALVAKKKKEKSPASRSCVGLILAPKKGTLRGANAGPEAGTPLWQRFLS
jgi:hypothetical protein